MSKEKRGEERVQCTERERGDGRETHFFNVQYSHTSTSRNLEMKQEREGEKCSSEQLLHVHQKCAYAYAADGCDVEASTLVNDTARWVSKE